MNARERAGLEVKLSAVFPKAKIHVHKVTDKEVVVSLNRMWAVHLPVEVARKRAGEISIWLEEHHQEINLVF